MNILLLVIQIFLAIHTLIGGIWKIYSAEHIPQLMPSLSAIPYNIWLAIGVVEIFVAIFLVLPYFVKRYLGLVPISALVIVIEMAVFIGLHIYAGGIKNDYFSPIYWAFVALLSLVVFYGRKNYKA